MLLAIFIVGIIILLVCEKYDDGKSKKNKGHLAAKEALRKEFMGRK